MVDEKESPPTVKVVDRRRFTTEGVPRDDVPRTTDTKTESGPTQTPPRSSERAASSVPPSTETPGREATSRPEPTPRAAGSRSTSPQFVELIVSLAQQAELLLVGAEDLPPEPDHARRLIDSLAALESKTAGNLSPEEEQILSNVIFQLRSLFLQRR